MNPTPDSMANAIRALAMDAVENAKSGHPGLPMGCADLATVLFTQVMKYDINDIDWPDRDRFVLSAGHGCMLLYACLYLTGQKEMTIEEIKHFRQVGSKTPGHPEVHHTPGVETTSGPLGQGLATAVGMALAERMLAAEFPEVVDHHTYVLCSDGDLMEGVSQEAIAIAGHFRLNKMIVFFDDNGISIDGPVSIADGVDQVARFKACGWNAFHIDGHDQRAVLAAIETAKASDVPTMIACKTTIGFGFPTKAGTKKAHSDAPGAEEIAGARKKLGWDAPPFVIPDDILKPWRDAGQRGVPAHEAWKKKLAALDPAKRAEWERRTDGRLPEGLEAAVNAFKKTLIGGEQKDIATRKASEAFLKAVAPAIPELILGSADLTASTNNQVDSTPDVTAPDYKGRFVHWGIREHGMAAAVNGMSLHKGFVPSGATFLTFSDYCRPSLRLAALMRVRAIQLFTHDSIGLGEDGPTHQPVEHLAALRAIPNMTVFRPADATETAECWHLALQTKDGPSILALTRQNLPSLRTDYVEHNPCARGAYELRPAQGGPAVASIFASGSEVSLAVEAQQLLADQGVAARVVSVPSMNLFYQQDDVYQATIRGDAPIRIGVEAAVRQGWDAIIGPDGLFVGMTTFGDSGPYKKVYEKFGITAKAVADAVLKKRAA